MNARRNDLPKILHDRERLMREAMKSLERMFPEGTGLTLLAHDTHAPGEQQRDGHMSYISNTSREQMLEQLRDQVARFEMGTDDTAGKEV